MTVTGSQGVTRGELILALGIFKRCLYHVLLWVGWDQGPRHREWFGSSLKFIYFVHLCLCTHMPWHTNMGVRAVIPGPHLTRGHRHFRGRCAILQGDGVISIVLATQTWGPKVKSQHSCRGTDEVVCAGDPSMGIVEAETPGACWSQSSQFWELCVQRICVQKCVESGTERYHQRHEQTHRYTRKWETWCTQLTRGSETPNRQA